MEPILVVLHNAAMPRCSHTLSRLYERNSKREVILIDGLDKLSKMWFDVVDTVEEDILNLTSTAACSKILQEATLKLFVLKTVCYWNASCMKCTCHI